MSDLGLVMAAMLKQRQKPVSTVSTQSAIHSDRDLSPTVPADSLLISNVVKITPPESTQPDWSPLLNLSTKILTKKHRLTDKSSGDRTARLTVRQKMKIATTSLKKVVNVVSGNQNPEKTESLSQKPEIKVVNIASGNQKPGKTESPSQKQRGKEKSLTTKQKDLANVIPAKVNSQMAQVTGVSEPEVNSQMAQVTGVSELSNVQPHDWALMELRTVRRAVRSLGERYHCQTNLGNHPWNRYEFASVLKICLDNVSKFVSDKVSIADEDLILIQRLQKDFRNELTHLQQHVQSLEDRNRQLAAREFSPTTRLIGQTTFGIQGTNSPGVDLYPRDGIKERTAKTNLTFASNVQLSLATSFTGRDLFLTGLTAGNNGSSAPLVFTNMGRLGYESDTNNRLALADLSYRFALAPRLGIIVGAAGVNPANTFRGLNPLEGSGEGAMSLFGQRNPILALGNTTGGIGFDWQISDRVSLQGIYSAELPFLATQGLFNGRRTAGAQLTLAPTKNLDIGLNYLYSHSPDGLLGTGIGDAQLISPFADPIAFNTHAVGASMTWRLNNNLHLGGWGGWTQSNPEKLTGHVETTNWMVFAALPNLLRPGNLGGILVGQPPKITNSTLPSGFNFPNFSDGGTAGGRRDTALHIELFYRAQLSENLSLTPCVIVVLHPDHNAANEPLIIGALRATFRF
jgi:Carbohydrate-selective porin, OprB family